MEQTWEGYSAHIREAVETAKANLDAIVNSMLAMDEPAIKCVDEFNLGVGENPPGTIWFLIDQKGWFEYLVIKMQRSGKKVLHIYWHHFCGYLCVIRGLFNLSAQTDYANTLMSQITEFVEAYGITVVWHEPDTDGTARPYMAA